MSLEVITRGIIRTEGEGGEFWLDDNSTGQEYILGRWAQDYLGDTLLICLEHPDRLMEAISIIGARASLSMPTQENTEELLKFFEKKRG